MPSSIVKFAAHQLQVCFILYSHQFK